MEFTAHNLRETHEAYGSAKITTGELMDDITTRWSANKGRYETTGIKFRPERVMFRWHYDLGLGWVLTQIRVSGPMIKKNGSDGLKTRSIDFIRAGQVIDITPSAIIALAAELAPKSKVIGPEVRLSGQAVYQ